jgi:hypothetical protein
MKLEPSKRDATPLIPPLVPEKKPDVIPSIPPLVPEKKPEVAPLIPPLVPAKPVESTPPLVPPLVPSKPVESTPPLVPPLVPAKPVEGTPPKSSTSTGDAGFPPIIPTVSTSKASPIAGQPVVQLITVDGPPPASPSAKRTVGFFNHTDKSIKLTVEGETVTLPSKHQVSATVPAQFSWKMDDGEMRKSEVPTAAPGLEVVIRR